MFRSDRKVCSDPRKQPAPQHGRPRSVGAVCPMPVPTLSAVPLPPGAPPASLHLLVTQTCFSNGELMNEPPRPA